MLKLTLSFWCGYKEGLTLEWEYSLKFIWSFIYHSKHSVYLLFYSLLCNGTRRTFLWWLANAALDSSRFPSLGIPRLELENPRWNSYVGHWNSYVGIPMSNVGIPTWVFSFLPRFLPNLMIFIIWMNLSSFIGTIYIEKSSNLAKIWAEMKKPRLEFLSWTLEFLCRNSNVQHRNSNLGFPPPT